MGPQGVKVVELCGPVGEGLGPAAELYGDQGVSREALGPNLGGKVDVDVGCQIPGKLVEDLGLKAWKGSAVADPGTEERLDGDFSLQALPHV